MLAGDFQQSKEKIPTAQRGGFSLGVVVSLEEKGDSGCKDSAKL